MSHELVKRYVGQVCFVSTGSWGTELKGEITAVEGNWLELTDKKGSKLLNLDYVTNIRTIPEK